jgi:putative peptide maturation system protein
MIQEEWMSSEINQTILGVVDEMVRLAREPAAPREGEARLKRRVQEHTGPQQAREAEPRTPMKIDVLWDQESVTGSVHYDALLRVPGWGSVSIGYSPERGLPWALRGTFRWSEVDMLRVNQLRIGVADVVTQLDFLWAEPWLTRQLVDSVLITEALEEEPDAFTASDEELQEAMDAFRRRRGLLTEEAMMHWLEQQGLTQRKLETRLEGFVKIRKLRQRVVAGREEAYFASHKSEFDVAVIARGGPARGRHGGAAGAGAGYPPLGEPAPPAGEGAPVGAATRAGGSDLRRYAWSGAGAYRDEGGLRAPAGPRYRACGV